MGLKINKEEFERILKDMVTVFITELQLLDSQMSEKDWKLEEPEKYTVPQRVIIQLVMDGVRDSVEGEDGEESSG